MKWRPFFAHVMDDLANVLLGATWAMASPSLSVKVRCEPSTASFAERTRQQSAAAPSPSPDTEMIERFRRAMLPQLDAAYSLARYLVRDPTSAEDCVQDAYVRALRAFPNYRGGDAKSWMLTIVRNCCVTWITSRSSERSMVKEGYDADALESIDDHCMAQPLHSPRPAPDAELASQQDAALLQGLIATLSPPLREVLVLREIEELSYREIAAIIDAPIGTVMSRLARARAQLAVTCRDLGLPGDSA